MLLGKPAPDIDLPCTRPVPEHPGRFRLGEHRGRWVMVMFYPRDFTFICPTELIAVSAQIGEFWARDCEVVGISVDPVAFHEEWIATAPSDGGVGPLRFPLASDVDGAVARAFGVYLDDQRVSTRGLFIIDPAGLVQYQVVHPVSVGRKAEEPLRVLDALRKGGLCPYGWTLGDGTIDPAKSLRPGTILGHYRIREVLGKGAFAHVFHARDLWLERDVAIKVLNPGSQVDIPYVLSEARAAAGTEHPNICTVHTVEEHEGLPVIVMEYVAGESLEQRLKRGKLDADTARSLARAVADAMAACHAADVVHGDLKPGNILMDRQGRPRLVDFGIASRHGVQVMPENPPSRDSFDSHDTEASLSFAAVVDAFDQVNPDQLDLDDRETLRGKVGAFFAGTPAYTAPELATGDPASPSADVFSFGVTLFEMLVGHPPFQADSLLALLDQIQAADLERLVRLVPPPLRAVVARSLVREPRARASMAELREMLS